MAVTEVMEEMVVTLAMVQISIFEFIRLTWTLSCFYSKEPHLLMLVCSSSCDYPTLSAFFSPCHVKRLC